MSIITPETINRIKQLMQDASVFEEDIEESFILGGGPGGQKTNKTSSVVRLAHEPSGLQIRCGQTRSRETNRWLARRMLAEKILEKEQNVKSAAQREAEKIRRRKRKRSRLVPFRRKLRHHRFRRIALSGMEKTGRGIESCL